MVPSSGGGTNEIRTLRLDSGAVGVGVGLGVGVEVGDSDALGAAVGEIDAVGDGDSVWANTIPAVASSIANINGCGPVIPAIARTIVWRAIAVNRPCRAGSSREIA